MIEPAFPTLDLDWRYLTLEVRLENLTATQPGRIQIAPPGSEEHRGD